MTFNKAHVLLLFTILTGCSPMYFPTPDTTPMFTEKNQAQFSGGVSTGGYFGQAAYAFADRWAAAVSTVQLRDVSQGDFTNHSMFEGSFGHYRNFNDQWCFELWGGFGSGKTSSRYTDFDWCFWFPCLDNNPYLGSAIFNNLFIQSTIGMNRNKFQWSVSSKINYLQFNQLDVTHGSTAIAKGRQVHLAFEPAMMMRVSLWKKRLFWKCQFGFSASFTNPQFDWVPIKFSNGLVLKIEGGKNSKRNPTSK
jgi:hypothetical protein